MTIEEVSINIFVSDYYLLWLEKNMDQTHITLKYHLHFCVVLKEKPGNLMTVRDCVEICLFLSIYKYNQSILVMVC